MKKLIALTFALAFLCATGIASAADITMSGSYFVRGTYQKNAEDVLGMTSLDNDGNVVEKSGTMYYDHEFDLNATWKIDDNTSIISQFEMRDDTWGSAGNATESYAGDETDNNIVLEKIYAWHKFANGHELRVGLMPSGAWGTSFGDNGSEAYRIRYDVVAGSTRFIGILQKNAESSSMSTGQGESDDTDAYYVGILTKVGNINVKPLFAYANIGNVGDKLACHFALDGTFGSAGFESEFIVEDVNYEDSATTDYRGYGAYVNVWNQSGPVKVGALGAYGSYDDDADASFILGPDFDGGGAMIMGYDNDFDGCWLGALYADYDVNDKLSIGGYAGFAKFHIDDVAELDGAKAWELSADASYKLTDNITYDMGAGMAQLKWGNDTADPDKAYRVFHRLTVNF